MLHSILIGREATWRAQMALLTGLLGEVHQLLPESARKNLLIQNLQQDFWQWQASDFSQKDEEVPLEEVSSFPSYALYMKHMESLIEVSEQYQEEDFSNYGWQLVMTTFGFMINLLDRWERYHNNLKPITIDNFAASIDYEKIDEQLNYALIYADHPEQLTNWLDTTKAALIAAYPFNPEDRMGASVPQIPIAD